MLAENEGEIWNSRITYRSRTTIDHLDVERDTAREICHAHHFVYRDRIDLLDVAQSR